MAKIKEILCMHHTHLDIGYTHVQPALLQLHSDYIDDALGLCSQTESWPEESRFRWTCESTLPVMNWLETATPESIGLFHHFLRNGQLCIAAQLFHATPLADSEGIARMLYPVRQLRERFGIELNTSINHDINGQPWAMSQILLDSGVKLHIMGINTHFGGYPLTRPYLFRWQAPDGRDILAFNGEIYVLFNWMFEPQRNDLDFMKEKIGAYAEKLEQSGYPFDFAFLTATNPPLSDNNCPDHELANLVRRWNEQDPEIKIRFATPEMLLERFERIPRETIPIHSGDWTDYWNFGSASAARETRLYRKARRGLQTADLLESFLGSPAPQYRRTAIRASEQLNLYTEHTWGHSLQVEQPDRPDVEEGWHHKANYAYQASGLTTYLLGTQMEQLAHNPRQSDRPEGILVFNPSPVTQIHSLRIPVEMTKAGRHLSARRLEYYTISKDREDRETDCIGYGDVEVPPFSWKMIPMAALLKNSNRQEATSTGNRLENQHHLITFDPASGRITAIWDKARNWQMIDLSSEWSFFQYVQETIDPLVNPVSRKTFYDSGKGGWNPEWAGLRKGPEKLTGCHVEQDDKGVSLVLRWDAPGVSFLEQRITLYHARPGIGFGACFHKKDIRTPEGTYFAFPLNLMNWRCHFDTAGLSVELDTEQLPGASRDWVTVDQTVSIHDDGHGITLACPDAPLVQIGGFGFGRKRSAIPRDGHPLLLAWPMNNYWETNFRASQPGFIRFYYELSSYDRFDPFDAFQAGIVAGQTTEIAAVVSCRTESEGTLISCEGDGIAVLYVKPAENGHGIILRARNMHDEIRMLSCRIPGREILLAFLTDTLEQDLQHLPVESGAVHIKLMPGTLQQIRIIPAECFSHVETV